MKFKEGDRVHVTRYHREDVDFYGTISEESSPHYYFLEKCSGDITELPIILLKPSNLFFGTDKTDYYVLAEDEEDTEEPVIQHINDMYNEVPKEKEQSQKVELKKQYIIEVKKGLYVDYVDSKEAFYFTKDITKACVFKNREYPTKFAEIIDAKILEIKRYVEV
ncbi:hypothetical protein [Mammaliicoccus lentus]|uniref:hypothetical protein n=1 Tax=Mammaliicoccus lentus TaxID=42858 RepID=UPI0002D6E57B|nr:hypothetical protein [Mammaliicoccus lentus]